VTRLAAVAVLSVALLTGCSSGHDASAPKPSRQACKAAMEQQFASALANPNGPSASRPAACAGLSDDTVNQITQEILSGATP
jgi:hypothetical protein